jgi:hypothetical protein
MTMRIRRTSAMRTMSNTNRVTGGRILNLMKRFPFSTCSFAGKLPLLGCLIASVSLLAPSAPLVAQQRGPEQRVVQGKAVDKGDVAIKGAVVYLKDDHSLGVKSYITDDEGGYRFGQLAQNTDYELWAESNGKKSPVKTISSFNSKNQFHIDLKIDTSK